MTTPTQTSQQDGDGDFNSLMAVALDLDQSTKSQSLEMDTISDSIRKIQRHSFLHNTLSLSTERETKRTITCCSISRKKKSLSLSQAVWCGRIVFVLCLTALAVGLGYVSYQQQASADQELAESLFVSMTDRALIKAVHTLQQKQWTITSLATVLGHLRPDAEPFPFVTIPSLQDMTNDMMSISTLQTLGWLPIVRPEQQEEFEQFAYESFGEQNYTIAAGGSPFGRGIFKIINGTRYPDNGTSSWGSPHDILTPVWQVESGDHPILLYNVHSDPKRGQAVDVLLDCVEKNIANASAPQQRCTTLSELIMSHKEAARGPSSANWAPVFPANDPTTLVGITGSLIVWEELLQNAFANQVSGIDAVLHSNRHHNMQGEAFTYTIVDGVAMVKGAGDLHLPQYDALKRSIALTSDMTLFSADCIGYQLDFYPNPDLYATYNSGDAASRAWITAGIVVFVSLLFFLYDFFVRREFSAKKELLESKRKFMRFVSHEVRTPLNAVCMGLCVVRHEIAASLGYKSAENLQQELDEAPEKDQQQPEPLPLPVQSTTNASPTRDMAIEWFNTANDVLANTQSAVDVLSDMLNYDRVQSNTLTLELTQVPIWRVMESTLEEFRLPATNKKIQLDIQFVWDDLEFDRAKDLPPPARNQQVVGDEIRLQQVIRNLASNAVKFTPQGGRISVRASCKNLVSRIRKEDKFELKDGQRVSLSRSGSLEVVVEDSGVGMTPEQLEKVCSAGVQFNVNELQGGKGSGLGLFITKGIVQQHNGTIGTSSPGLGRGTKFTVTLPLYHAQETINDGKAFPRNLEKDLEAGGKHSSKTDTVDTTYSSPGLQKETLRVLVVDDIAGNRKLLGRLLQINGHTFDQAEDGAEAVELVRKAVEAGAMYDSVLLDFEMPVMNGPDAAKEIRKIYPDTNIVGITGNMLQDDIVLFKSCGANEVMGKPFKMQILEGIWKQHGVLAD